jgi:hypothetical protein
MLGACFVLYYLRDLDTLWTAGSVESQQSRLGAASEE